MRVFVTVGEEGGFAAAARKLSISPAAVTRAIVALEQQLGVRLLLRTTRNVRLSDAGKQYYYDTTAILASIAEANEAVSVINTVPRGTLSITAPVLFGRMFVMPCIIDYMQRYPQVKVIANFADHLTNMVEEGIDVAIRIGHLPDSSLRATKVGEIRRVLCASPAYIDKHGLPKHPKDLQQHSIISSKPLSPQIEWPFGRNNEAFTVKINPSLIVTSNDSALVGAVGDLGITRLLSYQIKNEVESGKLQILLEEFEESPWPVNVVHREDKLGSAKVRNFIESTVEKLRLANF